MEIINYYSINPIIDELIASSKSNFKDFSMATTIYNLGKDALSLFNQISDKNVEVSLPMKGLPIKLSIDEFNSFKNNYPYFLLDIFHNKQVQIWNDGIDEIFSLLYDLHGHGRKFKELSKKDIKLDFNLDDSVGEQTRNSVINDFKFKKSLDRIKFIDKILNPRKFEEQSLKNIKKNVLIRNALQHRKGIIDQYIMNELGNKVIQLLDPDGKQRMYKEGEKIDLSIPELHMFCKSIVDVTNKWRII